MSCEGNIEEEGVFAPKCKKNDTRQPMDAVQSVCTAECALCNFFVHGRWHFTSAETVSQMSVQCEDVKFAVLR